jgi:uncharacterized protein YaeQ
MAVDGCRRRGVGSRRKLLSLLTYWRRTVTVLWTEVLKRVAALSLMQNVGPEADERTDHTRWSNRSVLWTEMFRGITAGVVDTADQSCRWL